MLDRTPNCLVPWLASTILLAAAMAGTRGADAAVIFDNFDVGGGFHPTDNVVAASAHRMGGSASAVRAAAKFSVTGGDYSLDSVTLPISETASAHVLRVRVAADAGGAPGTTLEVLSENQAIWPALSNPFTTTTTLASVAHPLLSNGASYWIVTELTSFPAGDPVSVDYRWFDNTSGAMVPFRQQSLSGGGLPSDPWTGFNGSLSMAFRVEGTKSITTYTWNVASGSWTVAANWTPQRTTPATDDILVFDGAVTPSATATDVPNQTIGQLRVVGGAQTTLTSPFGTVVTLSVGGGTGDDLVVSAGSKLALATGGNFGNIHLTLLTGTTGSCSGELTVAGAAHRILPIDAGSLVFESGSNVRTLTGFIGSIFDNSGTNGVAVFRSGSTYTHNAGAHPFGSTAPDSRVVFEHGSLCRYLASPGGGSISGRTYGDLELNSGTTLVGPMSLPCTVDNLTVINGGLRPSSPFMLTILANLTVLAGGTFDINPPSAPATVRFGGTGTQTIDVQGTGVRFGNFSTIEVVNPSGLNLGRYLFSDGTLSLSGGHLITGPYLLHLGQVAAVAGPKWVIGNLGRIMPGSAGTVTRNFEVGDASRAAGLTVAFASVEDSGTIVVRTDPGDHPDLAASGIDPSQSVNRVWNATNLGAAFTTYDITLNFDGADIDAGADPNLFVVGKRDGGSWSQPGVGTRTATSTQATGLTTFSDFAVGEQSAVGVEPITPAATALAPARPTPFHGSTVLEYSLARGGAIELAIYGLNGQRVRILERGERGPGAHRVAWDGRDDGGHQMAAGIYFARLVTGVRSLHGKVIKIM